MIGLIVTILLLGLLLWAAGQLPIDATIYQIIRVVVIVLVCVYVIQFIAGVEYFPGLPIGERLR